MLNYVKYTLERGRGCGLGWRLFHDKYAILSPSYMSELNSKGQLLAQHLTRLYHDEAVRRERDAKAEKVNVVGAGGALTAAYEQLRNAAENTEEHLLLQKAVRRFYRQLFVTRDESLIARSGNELAVELTLAGYVPNDTLTLAQVEQISALATKYYDAYVKLLKHRSLPLTHVTKWTLDVMAVEVESILGDHGKEQVFIEFAYAELSSMMDGKAIFDRPIDNFGAALYVAIHQTLLKSNPPVIRAALLRRYNVSIDDLDAYAAFNTQLDELIDSDITDKLTHIIDRQGAPLRILRRMIDEEDDLSTLLANRVAFLDRYEKQVEIEYDRVARRINRAIVRSIIFLIITKFIIGIAIEVPYDYWAHGEIIWLPLIINLFFPPVYMFALKATHRLPGYANTQALVDRIDGMLFGQAPVTLDTRARRVGTSAAFSVLYVVTSLVIMGAVMYGLLLLNFSLVHIAIFFIFLSAASFLGFRLSRLIRELEIVRSAQSGMTFIRDLLYLPFVVVGRWMSDKYSKVNVVTIVLDMMIELPLKTVLRLVRQWGAFIDERKDQI